MDYHFDNYIKYYPLKKDKDHRGLFLDYTYFDKSVNLEEYDFEGSIFYNCFLEKDKVNGLVIETSSKNELFERWMHFVQKAERYEKKRFIQDNFVSQYKDNAYLEGLAISGEYIWDGLDNIDSINHLSMNGGYLANSNFKEFDLSASSLEGAYFIDSNIFQVNMHEVSLKNSTFKSGSEFGVCEFDTVNFENTNIDHVSFDSCTFAYGTTFSKVHHSEVPNLNDKNFTVIENTSFGDCRFSDTNFVGVKINHAEFFDCVFQNTNFHYADLKNNFFKNLKTYLCFFNHADLRNSRFENADLEYARFENANLKGVVFQECDLNGIYLKNADIRGADFSSSNFSSPRIEEGILYNKDTKFPPTWDKIDKKAAGYTFVED